MRYIYYMIGILALVTLAVGFSLRDRAQVDVSPAAIRVNDRIITENELERLMRAKPHDMKKGQYIDSLIMNELLIQEAIRRDIHKEEAFRRSVENFYEQSLIKILLDRQYEAFRPIVTAAEVEKYRELAGSRVFIQKHVYPDRKAAEKGKNSRTETVSARFAFLSDNLKFIALKLSPGDTSRPYETRQGVVVYTLEKTEPADPPSPGTKPDEEAIRTFIRDHKKERLYDRWTDALRENARIWRKK
jgi:uncharacterized protein YktA (UPF0223 family)